MRKRQACVPSPAASPRGVSMLGAHHRAQILGRDDAGLQVWRMPGLSWVGIQVRVRIAWPWLNRIGLLAARRLGRGQPLQGRGVGPGRIVDDDLLRLARGEGREV